MGGGGGCWKSGKDSVGGSAVLRSVVGDGDDDDDDDDDFPVSSCSSTAPYVEEVDVAAADKCRCCATDGGARPSRGPAVVVVVVAVVVPSAEGVGRGRVGPPWIGRMETLVALGVGENAPPTGEEVEAATSLVSSEEVAVRGGESGGGGGGGCSGDLGNPDPCRTKGRSSRKRRVPCPTVGSRSNDSRGMSSSSLWLVEAVNKATAVDDVDVIAHDASEEVV